MKTQKQRIFSILAILTMAVILTCIFTACGDSDTGAQDAKPSQSHVHSYSEKNIESHYLASPATCTKKAKYYYSCSCGDSLFSNSSTFEYGDALGHSFTHYVSDNNATYEKDGTKTAKCDRCSETKTVVDKGSRLSYIEENFSLALVGNGYAITAYIGDLTNVHVPSTYQEKPIVSIETRAFYDCSKITEVSLPDTVNEIGEEAFGYCTSLKRIDISACKRIKGHAFIGCTSLTEMTIPNGVISIGEKPFAECSSLKKVAIYSGEISAKVFAGNKYIEEIILGENVTDIAQFAFAGCTALKQLTMPKVNDMQAFIAYYFGLETYSYTLNGSGTNKIVPERVNTYVYETNGVQHIFGIPADDTNWYYDGDGIEVGGVYYKYTGRPVAVSSWKDYYEVTINRAYQLPSSWKAEFYYMPNLSLQELTITDQLISTKNDVFKGLTCKIDVKQKYPVKSVSLVGNTEVFLDEFSISNYMLRVEHTDGFVEDILFEDKYLQSDINDLKTEGEKTLSFVYDNVVGESTLLLKLHTFENVSMDDVLVLYDNMPKSLVVKGATEGTTITYENNNQIEDGDYVVQATLVKPYYETKVLTATLSIRKEKYSIKYVFNNDEAVNDNPSEYRYGVATSLNIPSSKSGTFVSWYEDENYSRLFKGITETTYGNLILYGKFSTIFTVSGNTITGLTDIGKKFTEIAIPQQINGTTIKNIANSAFKDCTGLTSITIPDSMTSIDSSAFSGCDKLQDIYITDIAAWCNISGLSNLMEYGVRNKNLYLNNELLTSFTIPNGVRAIYSYTFYGCSSLTSITIGNNITSIGSSAFKNCTGLTSITIPDSVTSIGDSAFNSCVGLTTVNWNATLCANAGSSNYPIFENCSKLTTINIDDNVTTIPSYAFYNCSGLTSVTIPDSVTSIGSGAFYNTAWYNNQADGIVYAGKVAYKYKGTMPSNTSIVIKDGTLGIASSAFENCSGLTSVTILGSVTSIGGSAFYNCSGLTSITIPDSVTSIASGAFRGCSSLTSMTLPFVGASKTASNGYDQVFGYIFDYKTSFHSSVSGATYQYFSDSTIYYYYIPSSIKSVTITGGIIPHRAFYNCSGLTSVTILDSVTSIGYDAFNGCRGLTSITIPDSVTSIGYDAFNGCSGLTSVTIGNSVTSIGGSAFSNCSGLTSITIPNSVTSIGSFAFEYCTGLTSVTIPDSVMSIGQGAFYKCTGLMSIYYTGDIAGWCGISGLYALMSDSRTLYIDGKKVEGELIIPDNVTSIGDSAFYGCSELTSITIGNNITSIGSSAFKNCTGLTSITIPDSVTSIGDSAFNSCVGLMTVNWNATLCANAGSSNYPIFENCSKLTTINIDDNVTTIPSYAFYNCSGWTSVTIPDSVTSIGSGAFYNTAWYNNQADGLVYAGKVVYKYKGTMPSNTSIVIKDGTLGIASSAFENCSGLTSIVIPDSVTNIGDYAFENCSGLTSVTIGNGVTSIGSYAFSNCSGLTSITIPDSATSIASGAFRGCSGLTSIVIPDSVTSIGYATFKDCSNLTSMTLPFVGASKTASNGYDQVFGYIFGFESISGSSSVSGATYQYLSNYTSYYYYIPSSIKSVTITGGIIPYHAFYNCSGLTSITIPNGVTSIAHSAFYGCTGLTSVVIPDSVTSIGNYAFEGCSGLTSVIIGNSVTSIGYDAFYGCTGLTSITIPNSVTSIGSYAFYNCSGLKTVFYAGTEEQWKAISIYSDNSRLTSATRYYYSETEPALNSDGTGYDGNYWHYDTDETTIVIWVYKTEEE